MEVTFHLDDTINTAVDDQAVGIEEDLNFSVKTGNGRLTVSFSKMSTKISFFLSFLLSSFEIGFWIAFDEMELDLKNLGMNEIFFLAGGSVCTMTGSFTIKGRIASVVTSYG